MSKVSARRGHRGIQSAVIALLVNPNESSAWVPDVQTAARAKGVELPILKASNKDEIDTAFAALAGLHADAPIEGDVVLFMARREQLVALERRYRVPAIGRFREFADDGGLISYGPDLTDINRQLGVYAAKILSGALPRRRTTLGEPIGPDRCQIGLPHPRDWTAMLAISMICFGQH